MADESFILSLVGQLNQKQTEDNIRNILSTINKNLKNTNMNNIKVFNKEDLLAQGKIFIESIEDIQNEIRKQLKLTNEDKISIATIFDDKGAIEKFKVSVTDALKVLKEFNFEAAKFSDGSAGFVMNSSGTQQTTQQMQQMEEQAKRTKKSVAEIPASFNSSNWGSAETEIQSITKFLEDYYKIVKDADGHPAFNWKLDANNNIVGFTTQVRDAYGAVETLSYKLKKLGDEENSYYAYVYQGGNVKENTYEQQIKSITKLDDKLTEFKSKLLNGLDFKSLNDTQLLDVLKALSGVSLEVNTLKENINNATVQEIANAEALYNSVVKLAEGYKTENKVAENNLNEMIKEANAVEDMKMKLQGYKLVLDKIKATKLNPDSQSFIGNGQQLKDLTDQYYSLDIRLQKYIQDNKALGENVPTAILNEFILDLNKLNQALSLSGNEKGGSKLDSQYVKFEKLKIKLDEIRAMELNPESKMFIGATENIDKLNAKLANTRSSLAQLLNSNRKGEIVSKAEIDAVELSLSELSSMIKLVKKESGDNFEGDKSLETLNNRIEVSKSRLETLIQQWKNAGVYAGDFKTKVEELQKSLNGKIDSNSQLDNLKSQMQVLSNEAQKLKAELTALNRSSDLSQKVNMLKQQINAFETANPRASNVYSMALENLKTQLDQVANNGDFKKIQNEFKSLKLSVQQAGLAGKTFGQRMQDAFRRMSRYLGITSMMMYTVRAIREMINNVKELDTAMVRLKRVTDETDTTYKNMFDNAVKSAKELNASVVDILNSTATLSKLNFSPEVAAELANLITLYNNLAEIGNIDTATNDIVSIINGFNDLTADDAERIVDVLDNLGNRFAVSAADLGQILTRSSASLSEANNSLEEAVALGTVGNSIAMDASKVGRINANVKFYSKR